MDKRDLELKEKESRRLIREEQFKQNRINREKNKEASRLNRQKELDLKKEERNSGSVIQKKVKKPKADIPQNQNIINFNLIINQHNVENINHQNSIHNITNINSTHELKPQQDNKPKKKLGGSQTQGNNDKQGSSKSIKKKSSKAKKDSSSNLPKDESILTYLLGNNKTSLMSNMLKNEPQKQSRDESSNIANVNNEAGVAVKPSNKKKKKNKEEQNIISSIEGKPVTNTYPNNFNSPITTDIYNPTNNINNSNPQISSKVNETFGNNNFYSSVYQNIVPETKIIEKIRPTKFPVEDNIIYDDADFFNLTSYHLNVFINILTVTF